MRFQLKKYWKQAKSLKNHVDLNNKDSNKSETTLPSLCKQ